MKVLIGVPAFRLPDSVGWSLDPLIDTPAKVLVIDNAADQDVKDVLKRYEGKIEVIVNSENTYCNGAWNQILEYGLKHDFDVIGLGTDLILKPNWYNILTEYVKTSDKEVCLPCIISKPEDNFDGVKVADNIAGPLTFFPKAAADLIYPIPHSLKHWYGDTYMFGKLRANGWKTVVLGAMKAEHPWSQVTYRTPEAYQVIEQDKIEWKRLWDNTGVNYGDSGENFGVACCNPKYSYCYSKRST
jgi:hypothetical protein